MIKICWEAIGTRCNLDDCRFFPKKKLPWQIFKIEFNQFFWPSEKIFVSSKIQSWILFFETSPSCPIYCVCVMAGVGREREGCWIKSREWESLSFSLSLSLSLSSLSLSLSFCLRLTLSLALRSISIFLFLSLSLSLSLYVCVCVCV